MNNKAKAVFLSFFLIGITFTVSSIAFSMNRTSYLATEKPLRSSQRDYWPTEAWLTSAPEVQGMSSAKLNEMIDLIETDYQGMHSVIIIKNGYIVFEEYFGGYTIMVTNSGENSLILEWIRSIIWPRLPRVLRLLWWGLP